MLRYFFKTMIIIAVEARTHCMPATVEPLAPTAAVEGFDSDYERLTHVSEWVAP